MERAKFIHGLFLQEGLEDVQMDAVGNVLARLESGTGDPQAATHPLVVSAHLDTVFPSGTDLAIHIEEGRLHGPGIGDNSLAVAGLCGLLWMLRERRLELPFDLWLAANVCEEGLGDLRGMKAITERFGAAPRAYIVLEGMALGHIYHRGLGVRRHRISIQAEGGHSWIDAGRPSAIHELTRLATRITRLEVPQAPRTTLNIGVIGGGTSVNTIAAEASLELDLRSESPEALEALAQEVEKTCQPFNREGVEVTVEVIGRRPAGEIPADHPLVLLAAASLRAQGLEPKLSIGSTDANFPLSQGLPAWRWPRPDGPTAVAGWCWRCWRRRPWAGCTHRGGSGFTVVDVGLLAGNRWW
jgi:acetylornithine deacetylase/succinyl-diaminopimelate desuccinylase-like protein